MLVPPLVPKTEFPIFEAHPDLVYLDSAATTQKPRAVIEAEANFYRTTNANVHRGIYVLAEQATAAYEAARATVARFVGGEEREIVFTRGTTESINLVAQSFVRPRLKRGMQIITTIAEHHSNFVPWQQLAKERSARLTVIPVDQDGQIELAALERALTERPTTMIAVADVFNVLGTVNPTAKIIELAHARGVPVLVDAAQSLAHLPVNVERLRADFLVGSGHKLYSPTGIGFLWAKREHLEAMPPYQFGGEMIRSVSVAESTWNEVPWKFEAGTPNIAGAIGLAAAVEFVQQLGWHAIAEHEEQLLSYADQQLKAIDGLTILGPANPRDRAGVIAFVVSSPNGPRTSGVRNSKTPEVNGRWIHPHDLVSILDERNVELRAGRHCAEPLHTALGLSASARLSVGVYSSSDDIDRLMHGIGYARQWLSR